MFFCRKTSYPLGAVHVDRNGNKVGAWESSKGPQLGERIPYASRSVLGGDSNAALGAAMYQSRLGAKSLSVFYICPKGIRYFTVCGCNNGNTVQAVESFIAMCPISTYHSSPAIPSHESIVIRQKKLLDRRERNLGPNKRYTAKKLLRTGQCGQMH